MWQQLFLCILGLCSGVVIASGVAGLLIGLSIIPRYAGITRTGRYVLIYEDAAFLGIVLGNAAVLFRFHIPAGTLFLILFGSFSGLFLGSWILATEGIPAIILSLALGKCLGSFIYYFCSWQ